MRNANYQGPFGNTLLHGAVLSGDPQEVRRLLAAGADPRIANREGRTAIHVAIIVRRYDLCELLAPGREAHQEKLLDEALEATFPASDPIAVSAAWMS